MLLDSSIDTIAIDNCSTGPCVNSTAALHGSAWVELLGNLSLVNTHPAFGG